MFVLSCKKDQTEEISVILPEKITFFDTESHFTYTNKTFLSEVNQTRTGESNPYFRLKFIYNSDNKLIEVQQSNVITTNTTTSYQFAYHGNNKIEVTKSSGQWSDKRILILDNNSQLIQQQDSNGKILKNYLYDQNSNLLSIESVDKTETDKTFNYSNQKGIFSNISTPRWITTYFSILSVSEFAYSDNLIIKNTSSDNKSVNFIYTDFFQNGEYPQVFDYNGSSGSSYRGSISYKK